MPTRKTDDKRNGCYSLTSQDEAHFWKNFSGTGPGYMPSPAPPPMVKSPTSGGSKRHVPPRLSALCLDSDSLSLKGIKSNLPLKAKVFAPLRDGVDSAELLLRKIQMAVRTGQIILPPGYGVPGKDYAQVKNDLAHVQKRLEYLISTTDKVSDVSPSDVQAVLTELNETLFGLVKALFSDSVTARVPPAKIPQFYQKHLGFNAALQGLIKAWEGQTTPLPWLNRIIDTLQQLPKKSSVQAGLAQICTQLQLDVSAYTQEIHTQLTDTNAARISKPLALMLAANAGFAQAMPGIQAAEARTHSSTQQPPQDPPTPHDDENKPSSTIAQATTAIAWPQPQHDNIILDIKNTQTKSTGTATATPQTPQWIQQSRTSSLSKNSQTNNNDNVISTNQSTIPSKPWFSPVLAAADESPPALHLEEISSWYDRVAGKLPIVSHDERLDRIRRGVLDPLEDHRSSLNQLVTNWAQGGQYSAAGFQQLPSNLPTYADLNALVNNVAQQGWTIQNQHMFQNYVAILEPSATIPMPPQYQHMPIALQEQYSRSLYALSRENPSFMLGYDNGISNVITEPQAQLSIQQTLQGTPVHFQRPAVTRVALGLAAYLNIIAAQGQQAPVFPPAALGEALGQLRSVEYQQQLASASTVTHSIREQWTQHAPTTTLSLGGPIATQNPINYLSAERFQFVEYADMPGYCAALSSAIQLAAYEGGPEGMRNMVIRWRDAMNLPRDWIPITQSMADLNLLDTFTQRQYRLTSQGKTGFTASEAVAELFGSPHGTVVALDLPSHAMAWMTAVVNDPITQQPQTVGLLFDPNNGLFPLYSQTQATAVLDQLLTSYAIQGSTYVSATGEPAVGLGIIPRSDLASVVTPHGVMLQDVIMLSDRLRQPMIGTPQPIHTEVQRIATDLNRQNPYAQRIGNPRHPQPIDPGAYPVSIDPQAPQAPEGPTIPHELPPRFVPPLEDKKMGGEPPKQGYDTADDSRKRPHSGSSSDDDGPAAPKRLPPPKSAVGGEQSGAAANPDTTPTRRYGRLNRPLSNIDTTLPPKQVLPSTTGQSISEPTRPLPQMVNTQQINVDAIVMQRIIDNHMHRNRLMPAEWLFVHDLETGSHNDRISIRHINTNQIVEIPVPTNLYQRFKTNLQTTRVRIEKGLSGKKMQTLGTGMTVIGGVLLIYQLYQLKDFETQWAASNTSERVRMANGAVALGANVAMTTLQSAQLGLKAASMSLAKLGTMATTAATRAAVAGLQSGITSLSKTLLKVSTIAARATGILVGGTGIVDIGMGINGLAQAKTKYETAIGALDVTSGIIQTGMGVAAMAFPPAAPIVAVVSLVLTGIKEAVTAILRSFSIKGDIAESGWDRQEAEFIAIRDTLQTLITNTNNLLLQTNHGIPVRDTWIMTNCLYIATKDHSFNLEGNRNAYRKLDLGKCLVPTRLVPNRALFLMECTPSDAPPPIIVLSPPQPELTYDLTYQHTLRSIPYRPITQKVEQCPGSDFSSFVHPNYYYFINQGKASYQKDVPIDVLTESYPTLLLPPGLDIAREQVSISGQINTVPLTPEQHNISRSFRINVHGTACPNIILSPGALITLHEVRQLHPQPTPGSLSERYMAILMESDTSPIQNVRVGVNSNGGLKLDFDGTKTSTPPPKKGEQAPKLTYHSPLTQILASNYREILYRTVHTDKTPSVLFTTTKEPYSLVPIMLGDKYRTSLFDNLDELKQKIDNTIRAKVSQFRLPAANSVNLVNIKKKNSEFENAPGWYLKDPEGPQWQAVPLCWKAEMGEIPEDILLRYLDTKLASALPEDHGTHFIAYFESKSAQKIYRQVDDQACQEINVKQPEKPTQQTAPIIEPQFMATADGTQGISSDGVYIGRVAGLAAEGMVTKPFTQNNADWLNKKLPDIVKAEVIPFDIQVSGITVQEATGKPPTPVNAVYSQEKLFIKPPDMQRQGGRMIGVMADSVGVFVVDKPSTEIPTTTCSTTTQNTTPHSPSIMTREIYLTDPVQDTARVEALVHAGTPLAPADIPEPLRALSHLPIEQAIINPDGTLTAKTVNGVLTSYASNTPPGTPSSHWLGCTQQWFETQHIDPHNTAQIAYEAEALIHTFGPPSQRFVSLDVGTDDQGQATRHSLWYDWKMQKVLTLDLTTTPTELDLSASTQRLLGYTLKQGRVQQVMALFPDSQKIITQTTSNDGQAPTTKIFAFDSFSPQGETAIIKLTPAAANQPSPEYPPLTDITNLVLLPQNEDIETPEQQEHATRLHIPAAHLQVLRAITLIKPAAEGQTVQTIALDSPTPAQQQHHPLIRVEKNPATGPDGIVAYVLNPADPTLPGEQATYTAVILPNSLDEQGNITADYDNVIKIGTQHIPLKTLQDALHPPPPRQITRMEM